MHKVTKDAFTLILFSAVAAIASYLFTFSIARMMMIEDYSLLYSIIALTYILTIPQEAIRTVICRYTTKYNVEKNKGKIHELMNKSLRAMFIVSSIIFVLLLALTPLLTGLFHTNFWTLAAALTVLIFSFVLPVFWGIYQGLGKFKELGINNSIEGVLRLVIAILLVLSLSSKYQIYGALISSPISMAVAFLIGYWSFSYIRKNKKVKIKDNLTKYSLASVIVFGLVTLMYSVDVILARYLFSPRTAGIYAGISLICKALFFIAIGTKRAMMPNLAEKDIKSEEVECRKILKKISLLLGIMFLCAFVLFFFFPEQIVMLILGSKYLSVAPYLKYMIIAMTFFSFANLLVYYNLSLDKNKIITIRVLASAVFLEIGLLILFHKNLQQFVNMIMIVDILLFIAMLVVTIISPKYAEKRIEKEKHELKEMKNKKYKSPGFVNKN